MSDRSLEAAIGVLASTPATLRALLAPLPDEITSAAGAEGWSAKDVVAHLVSLNGPALLERVGLMLEQDDPVMTNIDEEKLLAASGLRARPLAELLDELAQRRAETTGWLRGLPPEAFGRAGRHAVAGRLTASEIVHHKAWHDLLHVQQVAGLAAVPLDDARGPMRMFR